MAVLKAPAGLGPGAVELVAAAADAGEQAQAVAPVVRVVRPP